MKGGFFVTQNFIFFLTMNKMSKTQTWPKAKSNSKSIKMFYLDGSIFFVLLLIIIAVEINTKENYFI